MKKILFSLLAVLYINPTFAMNTISFMDDCEVDTYCCHSADLSKVPTEPVYNDCLDGYTLRKGMCVCDSPETTGSDTSGSYTITFPSYDPGSRKAYLCTTYLQQPPASEGLACVRCQIM